MSRQAYINKFLGESFDGFRWLSGIGFPKYSINLEGICINTVDRTFPRSHMAIHPSGKQYQIYELPDKLRKTHSFKTEVLVAEAFRTTPKEIWKDSPFALVIEATQNVARLSKDDKVILPYKRADQRNYILTKQGEVWIDNPYERIPTISNSEGYFVKRFSTSNGKVTLAIHRLVAEYWISVPKELTDKGYTKDVLVVNHKDGNKLNNSVDNLEWVTQQENMVHARETGLLNTAISNEQLEEVWKLLSQGYSNIEIARITSMYPSIISNIRIGASPRYKTDKYTWNLRSSYDRYGLAEKKPKIIEMYKKDMTVKDISIAVHSTEETVRNILIKEGIYKFGGSKPVISLDKRMQIYEMLTKGKRVRDIADLMGVSYDIVRNIKSRKTFPEETKHLVWRNAEASNRAADRETRQHIYADLVKGLTDIEISRKYNVRPSFVHQIRARYTYVDETKDFIWRESSVAKEDLEERKAIDKKVIDLINAGNSIAETARIMKLSFNGIKRRLVRNNINYPTRLNNNS